MSGVEAGDVVAPPAAGAAIPGLHLVGDHQPAGGADHLGGPGHEPLRHVRQTLVGEDRADDQRREPAALALQLRDRRGQARQVGLCKLRLAEARFQRPVGLRERDRAQFRVLRPLRADAGHLADQVAVAVIGRVGEDDAALAGGEPRRPHRHLVGLGAAAAEDDALDLRPVQRRQPLGEGDDAFVQIAAVHVQRRLLTRHRLDHIGVGVTDAGHVVVHVDVTAAVGVVEVGAFAADDVQRRAVEQRRAGAQRLVATRP